MTIVLDKIAEYTAQLTRVVAAPTGDLGFGSDLSCTDDITADAAEVDGDSPLAVAQANYRRLRTTRGTLPDDDDYGLNVAEFLNHGLTNQSFDEIPGQVRSELAKDDRNENIDVVFTAPLNRKSFTLDIRGETAGAPFTLTLAVTDGGVLLKEISGNGSVS